MSYIHHDHSLRSCVTLFRPDISDIVILLTDGVTTSEDIVDFNRVLPQVKSMADIIVVYIGEVDFNEVSRIASKPAFVHQVTDFKSVDPRGIFNDTSCAI